MNRLLIATKLFVPTLPAHAIDRIQLYQRMQHALQSGQRLVLVSAPAGFGKSTLASGWITHAPHPPIAWLSLDTDDNYVEIFLHYLLAAIDRALPQATVSALLPSWHELTDSTLRLLLTPLVNTLAQQALPLVIVLDDYHVITNQLVHNTLTFLLKYLPACVQLVIVSRIDPPLPLASLRARQQLCEIRVAELRFSPQEARSFFHERQSVPLADEVFHSIMTSTEGWAVGLQLAALVMSDQSPADARALLTTFDDTNSFILEYLADEVFHHLPPTTQQFLLRTSILERLTDDLCHILLEDVADAPQLGDVLRRNLFLTQLGKQHWYRYHQLFRQFLRKQLSQTATEAEIVTLHVRASTWLMQHGFRYEAIHHVVEAEAWDDLLRLLTPAPSWEEIFPHIHTWLRWLGALPDAVLITRPDLYLVKMWGTVLGGDITIAEKGLERSDIAFSQEHQGILHLLRQHLAHFRGQHACHMEERTRALALLCPETSPLLWAMSVLAFNAGQVSYDSMHATVALLERAWQIAAALHEPMVMLLSAGKLGEIAYFSGHLRRAASWLNEVQHLVKQGYTDGVPFWCRVAAQVAYEHNDLVHAEQIATQGLELVQLTSRFHNAPTLYVTLARTHEALHPADDATIDGMLAHGYRLAQQYGRMRERIEIETCQLRRWLAQGDLPRAQHWCAAHPLDTHVLVNLDDHWLLVAHVVVAREMMRVHDDVGPVAAVEQVLVATNRIATAETGRMGDHMHLLTLHALLQWDLGRADEAVASLSKAVALGEPEGYLRTFLDEGVALLPLLAHPHVARAAPVLVPQLRALLVPQVPHIPTTAPASDLLSLREQEILHLVVAGGTVQTIATQLVISVHTARTHLKHIYAKLDAHTRVQVVEQARKHGLL